MNREAMQELVRWKNSEKRKPLVIKGARQVGKTWLMRRFGKQEYEKVAYINLESSSAMREVFRTDFNIERILLAIQIETGITIDPVNTLIILDEIQEAGSAITSLKYFQENAPQYHVICAGSLLGVALHRHTSFPVGKVDFLDLYPLSFTEFLQAIDKQPLVEALEKQDWALIKSFKETYKQHLKEYYYVGGMPEAVRSFAQAKDTKDIRNIQKQILTAYEQDFSKHAPNDIVPRIRMLWNSIPAQLAKENKKFIYGVIRPGARAREYELAMSWLIDCGLIHQVKRVSRPTLPLKAYAGENIFKLYLADVGLLGAMNDLDAKTLLEGNEVFLEFKGALTEQYVLQQLVTLKETSVYYWSAETAMAEIDFVLQYAGKVIPLEVKAAENLKAKSLRVYSDKFHPHIAVRTSMSDFRKEEWFINLPLYAINMVTNLR
jgi:predicted AAA+ superfamily ATPase